MADEVITIPDVLSNPFAQRHYDAVRERLLGLIYSGSIRTVREFENELNQYVQFDASVLHFMQLSIAATLTEDKRNGR